MYNMTILHSLRDSINLCVTLSRTKQKCYKVGLSDSQINSLLSNL